jgi:hypothetical protein
MLTGWTRLGGAGALLLGGFLAAASFGGSSGAQSAPPVTIPFPGVDVSPDVSDDGTIVVFASTDLTGESSIVVHDRRSDATIPVPGSTGGEQPAVSGDGCTIAWTVDAVRAVESGPAQAAGTDARLFVVDRCLPGSGASELVPARPVAEFGPPALSADGAVVVVSVGSDVVRFDRTAGGYAPTASFRPSIPGTPPSIDASVDLSGDGSTVVFAAGPDLDDPSGLNVYRVDRRAAVDTVSMVAAGAHQPTVSADGSIVAYASVVDDPSSSTVTIREDVSVPVPIGPGTRPVISGDGNHVVHETGTSLQLTSWTGDGPGAFSTTDTLTLTGPVAPTASRAAVDRFANTVVSDVVPVGDVETDITVNGVDADAGFDSDTYRLGAGDVGTELSTIVTFTNDGPASLGVSSVSVDGTFVVRSDTCTPVVRPGSTCGVDVGFTVEFLEDAFGTVTLVPVNGPVDSVPFTTRVLAVGQAPPTDSSTTTTTPRATTGGTSTGGSRTTTGGWRTSSTGGRRTTSTTGGRTTTATTTTVDPGSVAFSPTTFDFAPTIVEAGRRTGLVEIVNTTANAASVVGVRLEPVDVAGFEIAESDCAGTTVPANGRCSVTIAFAPDATGAQSVQLIASLDGDGDIVATISGVGAEPPTLTVTPGVATIHQVVTIRGDGFPTGLDVELTWGGSTQSVVVDDTGGFAIPVVLLPHTRRGPAGASVAGQPDQFGDVTATMLVTATSSRSQPGILEGVGPNIGR